MIPLIPDSAPFSPQQRAWLNGFFAGMLGAAPTTDHAVATSAASVAGTMVADAPVVEDDPPWHDPTLPLAERLRLAEDRPHPSRLMAAMAQLDCGACGYLCKSYSAAIASGAEKDLTRCAPGGPETVDALKKLVSIHRSTPTRSVAESPAFTRANPFAARIESSRRLTHAEAPKDTRHVAIDLLDSGITYEPGDALGICPVNCPDLVNGVLDQLCANGNEAVTLEAGPTRTLRDALAYDLTLARVRPPLLELLANAATDRREAGQLRALSSTAGGPLMGADLCEVLERFPSARPPLDQLTSSLARLQPRLYSISSSLKKHPGQVHLTVGVVRFESAGRWRSGVASHFLGVRSNPGDEVRVFVQRSLKFRLPDCSDTPVVMVGPGTGIAPFRAFLQEREAVGAKGRNWLVFGNQYFGMDFLYRDELDQWARDGLLTRLDLAFSRDTAAKVYVQDRLRENAAELWTWLEAGAHFYVCGDARQMAPDVDATLQQIVADQGRMSAAAAKSYVAELAKSRRYQRDIY